MPLEILREPISHEKFIDYARATYGDMVKVVVDIKRRIVSIGGELHSDGEALLMQNGSKQEDLWGGNVYVEFIEPSERVEYSSLINIKPSLGNRAMEVQDLEIKKQMREIIDLLIP